MPSRSIIALGALALIRSVSSLAFDGPQPTLRERIAADAGGTSPVPTEAPEAHHADLLKRALALPRTCGWLYDVKASRSSVYACGVGTCAYYSRLGTTAQGCCSAGLLSCVVPTTCYDYAQYTSSRCDTNCQLNDFNLVCSRSSLAKCQTYTFAGRGVVGYGCDTDTESTSTTVYSTFYSTPLISTALGTNYTAFMSTVLAVAFNTASTSRLTGIGATTTSRYSSGSGYTYDNRSSSTSAAILIPVIVIIVLFALGACCSLGLLIWLFRRHKRNLTQIDQQNAARAGGLGDTSRGVVSAVPYNNSNVIMPGSHQSTYYAPQDSSQTGFYSNQTSPQISQTHPATVGTPPPVSGSPAPTYASNGAPNTNSMYGAPPDQIYSPAPQGQAFQPHQPGAFAFGFPQPQEHTPQQQQIQPQVVHPPAEPSGPHPPAKPVHEMQ